MRSARKACFCSGGCGGFLLLSGWSCCASTRPAAFRSATAVPLRLLCQCSGKIPRPHHIDIVFLAVHRRHPSQIFRPEGIVQIIPHQHPDPVAHGIRPIRAQPAPDSGQQFRLMLRKHLGAEAIADCPVIHIGQKRSVAASAVP